MALGVAALALFSRLVFLAASPDRAWPHSICYEGDAIVWAEWAAAIAAGRAREFNSGLPFYPPGVAYLIRVLGPPGLGLSYAGLKMLWCGMSGAACGLAYLSFVQAGVGRRAGIFAGVWCAFSFALSVLATSLNSETPYLLLIAAIVLGTLRMAQRPGLALGLGLGVLHGAANLLRAEHTLLLVMLAVYLLVRWRAWRVRDLAVARRLAGPIAAVGVGFAITCLPWSIHATRANIRYNTTPTFRPDYAAILPPWTDDARAFFDSLPEFSKRWLGAYLYTATQRGGHERVDARLLRRILLDDFGYFPQPVRAFTLVASSGPLAFALANHPQSRGEFSKAGLDNRFNSDPDIDLALPTHLRVYNHGFAVGLGHIRSDPGVWVRNVRAKLATFWSGATLGLGSRNLPIGRAGERPPVDMITHIPGAALWWRAGLAMLIGAGALLAAARRRGGVWFVVIAYKAAVAVLFFGYARQAASVLPAFALFGAISVDAALAAFDGRAWARRALRTAGTSLVLFLLAADLSTVLSASRPRVEGRINDAPRWGPGAFRSVSRLRIRFEHPGAPASVSPNGAAPTGTPP